MFERMLDKQTVPSFDEMIFYCGEAGKLWVDVDKYLHDNLK